MSAVKVGDTLTDAEGTEHVVVGAQGVLWLLRPVAHGPVVSLSAEGLERRFKVRNAPKPKTTENVSDVTAGYVGASNRLALAADVEARGFERLHQIHDERLREAASDHHDED